MSFSTLFRPLLAIAVAALLPVMTVAAGPQNLDARGVALHGYDPVAYCIVTALVRAVLTDLSRRALSPEPAHHAVVTALSRPVMTCGPAFASIRALEASRWMTCVAD